MSRWWSCVVGAALFFCGATTTTSAQTAATYTPDAIVGGTAQAGGEDQAGGKELYLLHCAGCHRPDGRGALPEVPSLHGELGRLLQVQGGRTYLVRVPGAAQAPVSDEALTRILNWVLTTFNADTLAAGFVPLSDSEVARARQQVLADPIKYRAELWSQLGATATH